MRFSADIEIPRFTIAIQFEADSWNDAIIKANQVNPLVHIKTDKRALIMDSDKSRVVTLLLQD